MGEKKIRNTEINRQNLRDIVPLKTPLALNIEPASSCNFRCKYCGQSLFNSSEKLWNKGVMSFDLYKKIIDDVKCFPSKLKSLLLYHRGEPLLNPNIAKMVTYAKKAEVADEIIIFSNASLLKPKLSDELIDAGLDYLNISIQGISKEDYLNVADIKIDFDELVNNIRYYYDHKTDGKLYIKMPYNIVGDEGIKKFETIFSKICDYYFMEHLDAAWQGKTIVNLSEDEQKSITNRYNALKKYRRRVCPWPFIKCLILHDGIVTPCVEDHSKEMILGDAGKDSIVNIWNGKAISRLCYAQLTGKLNNYRPCTLDCIGYKDIHHPGDDPDNLDGLSPDIIELYKKGSC